MIPLMKRDSAIQILRGAAPELRARYGVVSAQLFGSVARDEADDLSGVDVAVRFEGDQPANVMALCGVSGLLSSLFALDSNDPGMRVRADQIAKKIK
jgi:predicted nucleotidyltransferase